MSKFSDLSHFFSRLLAVPWYPITFSAYPALALLSANVGQVQPSAGIRSLVISLALGAVLFILLMLFIRHVHRAAFLTTLWLALFFTYGHAYMYLNEQFTEADYTPWLAALWIVLFALSFFWGTHPKLTFVSSPPILNTMAVALIAMTSWRILSGVEPRIAQALGADHAPIQTDLTLPADPPDVYYFILDSYARADLLDLVYGYDNTGFLDALKERGFYVAGCSQSNYVRTEISMASSLNMMYLQDLDDEFKPDSTARRTLWKSLKHSAVRYNFESMGYQTISFPNGYPWSELDDADLFITPPPFNSGLTDFEGLLLRTTLARYLQDWGIVDPDAVVGQTYRDLFNNIFDHVQQVAGMPGPQFVYLHVISPHPPFVFDADGAPTYPPDFWNEERLYPYDKYAIGYTNQVTHLNQKVLEAVDSILAESETPPLIIIQGDHGPWMQPKDRRMWILNAYHLPGHQDALYSKITPVNTFRIVFNAYFGGRYDMLEDVAYFSPVPNLYDFSAMPNQCGDQ